MPISVWNGSRIRQPRSFSSLVSVIATAITGSSVRSNTLTNLGDTVNLGESDYVSDGEGYNLNARLEFSRKLNDEGRVFSGSLTGGLSDSYNKGLNYSNTEYFMGKNQDELIDQQFRYDNKGFNYRVYLSWVEPIGHNNFIQGNLQYQPE